MMFFLDGAFAIELIALVLGGTLLYRIKTNAKIKCGFCHFIAWFVIILAFLSMICTTVYGLKYWADGYFNKPYPMKNEKQYKEHYWKNRMHNKD